MGFLIEGLSRGEPGLIAVPGDRLERLRHALNGDADRVEFVDMRAFGRNPARIIPAVTAFLDEHAGRRVRFVGEPIWADRSGAEIREATRHEALINLAFAGRDVSILCPYDTSTLDGDVLLDAECTHPTVGRGGLCKLTESASFAPAPAVPPSCDGPLSGAPSDAQAIPFGAAKDLARLRRIVLDCARRAGLSTERGADLALATDEVATNTILHAGGGGGVLRIWEEWDRVIVEIQDGGRILDPLVGRRRSLPQARNGWGLRVVNELCDLVEIRSDDSGTAVRLHTPRTREHEPGEAGTTTVATQ